MTRSAPPARRRPADLGDRTPARGATAAASAPHPIATQIAIDVLWRGGSAADATVAAAAACTVVQPFSSSVAGVGWATMYDAATGTTTVIDFHGAVPKALDPAALPAGRDGLVDWQRLESGGRTLLGMLTPCVVPGWAAILATGGRWTLADVLAPAIELAAEGFPVTPAVAKAIASSAPRLARWGESANRLLPGGRPLAAGDRLVQSDLAGTLERVAANGPDELVDGKTADALVRFAALNGGALTSDDLAEAAPQSVPPLVGRFRDLTIHASPGPYGDVALLEGLHLLDAFGPFAGPVDPDYVHTSVEIAKLVAADRVRHLGGSQESDPAALLLDPTYLAGLRRGIGKQASAAPVVDAGLEDTITLAVVDGDGNAVHLMQTVGTLFGTGAIAEGTGLFVNSSLYFGYPAGDGANRIEPGRPVEQNPCTMLAFDADGRFRVALGTPGGKTRVETVKQMLVGFVDFGLDLQAAIDERRFVTSPEGIAFEEAAGPIPAELEVDLVARGHRIVTVPNEFGTGQAVAVDPATGDRLAAADWRLEAAAAAY